MLWYQRVDLGGGGLTVGCNGPPHVLQNAASGVTAFPHAGHVRWGSTTLMVPHCTPPPPSFQHLPVSGHAHPVQAERHPAPCRGGASLLWAVLVVLVGIGVYHNSFSGQFLFDDYSCIVDNPSIRTLWPLRVTLSAPPETALAGRPVVALSLAVNYALGRLDVRGYHVVNLTLHLVSALLVLGIVRRTLLSPCLVSRYGPEASWLALAVALVWMTHPLLTESVTYLIQRTELFMAFFFLLTLYSVIRGAGSPSPATWCTVAVVSCALGMASKEVMVVAPLLVLLYDRVFLSGSVREAFRKRLWLYGGLSLTWVVLVALMTTGPRTTTAGFGVQGLTPWDYAVTQLGVILHYLRLAFWPYPLVVDYSDWPIAKSLAGVAPAAGVIGTLVIATCWAIRRWPPVGFLGAWFFATLAPTSSILPIVTEVAAERRMYLPLCAAVVLVVMGAWEFLRRVGWQDSFRRRFVAGLVIVLVGVLGGVTVKRNAVYRSEVAILREVIAARPKNARAHYNLGIALAEQGQRAEAIAHLREALRWDPQYAEAHGNLSLLLAQQGQREEAVVHYTEALRLNPSLSMPSARPSASRTEPPSLVHAAPSERGTDE